jgi:hypothetical protein
MAEMAKVIEGTIARQFDPTFAENKTSRGSGKKFDIQQLLLHVFFHLEDCKRRVECAMGNRGACREIVRAQNY